MIQNVHSYLMPTYGERKIEFIRGEGVYLFSSKNTKYLDFGSGIAVNSLGHCHPSLVKALRDQSSKLWHTSNLYYSEAQEEYAALLCKYSFAEKVFFTNSGAESIECGLKVIRSYSYYHKNFEKKNIITLNPEIRIYNQPAIFTSEADIKSSIFTDKFLVMSLLKGEDYFNVRYQNKPFMLWIWISISFVAFGGLISFVKKIK